MLSVGQQLKQARKQLGYSLEEMERRTKIHISYLRALESDHFESLSNPVYVRAYIRAYAKELGLPAQPLIDQYESMSKNAVTPQGATNPQIRSSRTDHNQQFARNEREKTTKFNPISSPSNPDKQALDMNTIYMSSPHLNRKFLPRKVAMKAKESTSLSRDKGKKKGRSFTLIAVIGALLLIGGGGYYYYSSLSDEKPKYQASLDSTPNNPQVKNKMTPLLEPGEANDLLGQMFYITNVDRLEVKFLGKNEPTKFRYGASKDNYKEGILKPGEVFKMDTSGKSMVWFWLEVPSNFEVTINDQLLDTSAQDLAKSYRVQIKK
ncbi:helix-turn-helix domain-containing protein [Thermoflavimicrobium dichotomicum]|uniref:Helix-turn-helix domain-containing protein n=1 Tax=Thermoflavimicrobium dichotomicum TaxID=46223 RepID=A0A1I3PSV1_9BACL|nr:helix-turn-helix transcriptional regulator [Thermoflavimicrobium dichotomicum]SFJ24569.1 Helix-turn-helix domain-containing protein [Thermoflavimicrobium dichotomicum]